MRSEESHLAIELVGINTQHLVVWSKRLKSAGDYVAVRSGIIRYQYPHVVHYLALSPRRTAERYRRSASMIRLVTGQDACAGSLPSPKNRPKGHRMPDCSSDSEFPQNAPVRLARMEA